MTGPAPSAESLVVALERIGTSLGPSGDLCQLRLAGGKAANLGEMLRAGFPVPAGFVVTTAAYERFVARNGLQNRDAVPEVFEGAPIPSEVERELLAAYRDLGEGPVAVRSSATAEDLPEASFAGQQDTFLNVVGAQALMAAVRGCWASLWTGRAIAYRRRLGIDHACVSMAVVVQRMVAAEAAGVMFTADPVSGAREVVVIDASPGLGEAVAAGLVTPDRLVVHKRSGRVKERQHGRREVVVRARPEGGTETVTGPAEAEMAGLPVRRLVGLGRAIERHFGVPQDIEWAWDGHDVFILQARPVTALPAPVSRRLQLLRLRAGLLAELLPSRPYPLDVTTWAPAVFEAINPVFSLLGLAVEPWQFVEQDGVVVRIGVAPTIRPTPSLLLAPARILRLALRHDPFRWRADPLLADMLRRCQALEAQDLQELPWWDLLTTLDEALAMPAVIGEVRCRYLPRPALAAGLLRFAFALLGGPGPFMTWLAGVETKTLETNRALERLASRVRADPTLQVTFAVHDADDLLEALEADAPGRALLAELRLFLAEYGHREGAVLLVSQPTWKDAPEVVLGILKGLAAAPPPLASEDAPANPLPAAFASLLACARLLLQIREDTHFYATMPLPVVRRTLLELGRRLADVGLLESADDVFHLKRSEIEQAGPPSSGPPRELRALVLQRKERRAALADTPLHDPALFRAGAYGELLVRGMPGSPGVAGGPVRVIRHAGEFSRLRPGEVLVAPYTNPAWTPLFQRAAAVVVDSGGVASHAAIVAREYSVPAVMGTGDATRRLYDGQLVRVDGTRGTVTPLRPAG
ncbi:MAG: PEP/pyruvate-binding domain-containing protein [Nitriliruptorales bacterium]